MLNINKKYFNIINNKSNTQIKDGDIVRYSVMRKLDSNKALINIMGKKVVALFKNGMTDKGFAVFSNKNGEVTLTLLKDVNSLKEARESINNNALINNSNNSKKIESTEVSNFLIEKGIKPSSENIKYIETILKYLPNIDINKKKFILQSMSNGIYLTVEEIESFGKIFSNFNEIINTIKKSNKNAEITETLLMLADTVLLNENNENLSKSIKNYISTNADFAVWFVLFDMLQDELSSDGSNMLALLLKILSSNKKNRNLKENVFMLPIPIIIDNEVKQLILYINKNDNKSERQLLTFTAYDYDKKEEELFEISIYEIDERYLINIKLFDKNLFDKCDKKIIENDLIKFTNIYIEINYAGDV